MNILTITDICNCALDMVNGQNIHDIDDETNPNAELCKRHFASDLKSELSRGEWTFARRFIKPVLSANQDIPGYNCYVLPKDFGRLSLYFFSQAYPYRTNQYDRRSNYFLTSKCIYTRFPLEELPYITDEPELSELDANFVKMLEATLAVSIAPKIMGTDANVDFLFKIYMQYKHNAMRNGLLQMEASATGFSETQLARL